MKAIVLERLHADHHRYQALLCIFDRQLSIAVSGDVPEHRLMARLCHYLIRQPEEWHYPMEDILFQRLANCDPHDGELLAVLSEEHRRIERYGSELEVALRRLADESPESELTDSQLWLAQAFSELYHHHLHSENHHAYPLIERCLSTAELDELALPLASPAEGSPSFQLLYRQITDHGAGLRLGHGEQADFCPLCDARPDRACLP